MIEVSSLTSEFLRVPVSARVSGILIDPTTNTVTFAVPIQGVTPTVFTAATWDTDVTDNPTIYHAQWLVNLLAVGTYDLWIKIVANGEVIVRKIGAIRST